MPSRVGGFNGSNNIINWIFRKTVILNVDRIGRWKNWIRRLLVGLRLLELVKFVAWVLDTDCTGLIRTNILI